MTTGRPKTTRAQSVTAARLHSQDMTVSHISNVYRIKLRRVHRSNSQCQHLSPSFTLRPSPVAHAHCSGVASTLHTRFCFSHKHPLTAPRHARAIVPAAQKSYTVCGPNPNKSSVTTKPRSRQHVFRNSSIDHSTSVCRWGRLLIEVTAGQAVACARCSLRARTSASILGCWRLL